MAKLQCSARDSCLMYLQVAGRPTVRCNSDLQQPNRSAASRTGSSIFGTCRRYRTSSARTTPGRCPCSTPTTWRCARTPQSAQGRGRLRQDGFLQVKKADVGRAFILHRFGGLYLDIDVQCFRDPTDSTTDYDFIIQGCAGTLCHQERRVQAGKLLLCAAGLALRVSTMVRPYEACCVCRDAARAVCQLQLLRCKRCQSPAATSLLAGRSLCQCTLCIRRLRVLLDAGMMASAPGLSLWQDVLQVLEDRAAPTGVRACLQSAATCGVSPASESRALAWSSAAHPAYPLQQCWPRCCTGILSLSRQSPCLLRSAG